MKISKFLCLALVFMFLFSCRNQSSQESSIQWVVSTQSEQWVKYAIPCKKDKQVDNRIKIEIDLARIRQQIDGFGGCFNELGWEALNLLDEGERQTILFNLFDLDKGCKFNICRMPIGANDYAVDWYSHNEIPGDYLMENFSIDRDRQRLIPYIQAAKDINPELKVWASPWCPPTWMKTNEHYACRADSNVNDLPDTAQGDEMVDQFILDNQTMSAYAIYFSKFLTEYKREGIDIYAVHVQNEPNSCQNFPSCVWTPNGLSKFIGAYLGPQLETDHPEVELWLGTIERPNPERVDAVLQDSLSKQFIKGVGFQWAGKGAITHVNENYPNLRLMQTETECGDGSNDWKAMEYTFDLMRHYFNNGANSYMYWNMVLDNTGRSQWGWKQNSMITITEQKEIVYNPEFYLMKHLSAFVKPDAYYIKTNSCEDCMVFLNPGNELIILYYNRNETDFETTFSVENKIFSVKVAPKSLNTFCMSL